MKKLLCIEIDNGVMTGSKFEINQSDFTWDLKKCAKTHSANHIKVFLDSKAFNTLKNDIY